MKTHFTVRGYTQYSCIEINWDEQLNREHEQSKVYLILVCFTLGSLFKNSCDKEKKTMIKSGWRIEIDVA